MSPTRGIRKPETGNVDFSKENQVFLASLRQILSRPTHPWNPAFQKHQYSIEICRFLFVAINQALELSILSSKIKVFRKPVQIVENVKISIVFCMFCDLWVLRSSRNPSIKHVSTWLICLLSQVDNTYIFNEFQVFCHPAKAVQLALLETVQNVRISIKNPNVSMSIGICMFLFISIYFINSII